MLFSPSDHRCLPMPIASFFALCRTCLRRTCCAGLLAALLVLSAAPAAAQVDIPQVTRTYAIENARIVQAPGRVIERGTVVVRDGLILAVGEDVEVPYDARRIAGDSLVVYAGFIDGLSHTGVSAPPQDEDEEEVERPGDPPYDRAGIQPDRHVRALLDPSDDRVEELRGAGFTTAHVAPEGGMLPGTGAVIQLAGEDPAAMMLVPEASLFMQFEGASGVYPATSMAVISTLRQLYRETQRRREVGAQYAEAPLSMERPPADPVHSAFFPDIDGTRRIMIQTEDVLEIHRALRLQEELGFPYALAGLAQSFDAVDALARAEAPLFLTLDLPEAPEDTSDAAAADSIDADSARVITPEPPGSFFRRDLRTRTFENIEDEQENLEARQALSRRRYYETAADLHEAGLRFGFSTASVEPDDVHANLRLMIENGLPEEAALAALTTDAAALLNLSDRLGSIDEGKIANLVLTTQPIFEEDAEVRYVFVDGQLFEHEADEEGRPAEGVEPAGTWRYTAAAPQGEAEGTLTLTGDPADLSGTISLPNGNEAPLEDVRLDGATLTFDVDAGPMGTVSAEVAISGDEMQGTVDVPGQGEIPFTATRTSEPEF